MATFGSVTGSNYLFGRISVTVPGTPANLNQNVPFVVPGVSGNQPTMRCNEITFKAPGGTSGTGSNAANVGNVYVCYKGGSKAVQNSIIVDLQPGQGYVMSGPAANSPFDPSNFVIDADSAGDGCRVSAVIAGT